MKHEFLSIDKIIDLKRWQDLQDSLALTTNMAIITVDYKGNPVTNHSSCHEFCLNIRNNPNLAQYCRKCDSRGGLEAARINAPYIYLCHYNIVDIAIPIIIEEKYIGAILAGQIMLTKNDNYNNLEQIAIPTLNIAKEKFEELAELYSLLPEMSFSRVKIIAEMLFHLCNYIVEEALDKNFIIGMYEKVLEKENPSITTDLSKYSLKTVKNIKSEISKIITNANIKALSNSDPVNSILKPAFDYINNNKNETATIPHMAELCHVSNSYFSKIFSKEVGEPFSIYISRLKITWAKELLKKTDMTITHISDELGFSDAGYFTKTFKKFENTTPSLYRKYYGSIQ